MELILGESPTPDLRLVRYEEKSFPEFASLWTLKVLAPPVTDKEYAVVLESRSDRDLTVLRCEWIITREDEEPLRRKVSSDSYAVEKYQAVLRPGERMFLSPCASVRESGLGHARPGGGMLGCGSHGRPVPDARSIEFRIDMALFADGELCGPDNDGYAAELHCRKPAAEFVAKQVLAAEAENRDVSPVLRALVDMPRLRDDRMSASIRRYALSYLRIMHKESLRTVMLRHLGSQPTLPTFYRRSK